MSSAATPLDVSPADRAALETWSRSRVLPGRQVLRAKIVLLASAGIANEVIASQLNSTKPTVLLWRRRFQEGGLAGLEEAPGCQGTAGSPGGRTSGLPSGGQQKSWWTDS